MYSAKSYYEITLFHLLTFVKFIYSVQIQRTFLRFCTAMANDREITQKNRRPGLKPDDIKTAGFLSKRKTTNRPKITLY